MMDILSYSFITPYNVCISQIKGRLAIETPLEAWLLQGQTAEHLEITPTNNTQTFTSTSKNKYLASVTVSGKIPKTFAVTVAASSADAVDLPGAVLAESDTPATATATASGTTVTITGVAAGTTCIRAYNAGKSLIGIIVVTVTAA